MAKPTFDQETYARDLVDKMREESMHEAEAFARKVYQCEDRGEMSNLIDQMKRKIAELDD